MKGHLESLLFTQENRSCDEHECDNMTKTVGFDLKQQNKTSKRV